MSRIDIPTLRALLLPRKLGIIGPLKILLFPIPIQGACL